MDGAHLHLILNHIPVFGLLVGFLLLAWGMVRGYNDIQKAALVTLFVTAATALPVYLTGEPAEDIVEKLPGVSEQIMSQHEDSAMFSLIMAMITGVLALGAIAVKRFLSTQIAAMAAVAVLIVTLITGGAMAFTANLGGQIRHTEIRNGQPGETPQTQTEKRKEKDDD